MRERMTWQHQIQMKNIQSNTTVRAKYTARESDVSEIRSPSLDLKTYTIPNNQVQVYYAIGKKYYGSQWGPSTVWLPIFF